MKKAILVAFVVVASAAGGFIIYRSYFPKLVARAIVNDKLPGFLPGKHKKKIETVRSPVNAGAADVVKQLQRSRIPLDKILTMIDNTTEDQVYSLLDELTRSRPNTTDQVFDIARKHLQADFNLEILREPFNKNVNLKMIEKVVRFMNNNRKTKRLDIETAKEIAKELMVEKEKELQRNL